MGRRTKYTNKLAAEICERLAAGETLTSICRDEHMPTARAVYDWMDARPEFASRIACARDVGFDAIAERALTIADTPQVGEETEDDGDRVKVKRADMTAHRKLQVWTRLQLLAKWCPAKYGDKSRMEVTGADGGPVQISDADRAARVAGILALAAQRKAAGDGDEE